MPADRQTSPDEGRFKATAAGLLPAESIRYIMDTRDDCPFGEAPEFGPHRQPAPGESFKPEDLPRPAATIGIIKKVEAFDGPDGIIRVVTWLLPSSRIVPVGAYGLHPNPVRRSEAAEPVTQQAQSDGTVTPGIGRRPARKPATLAAAQPEGKTDELDVETAPVVWDLMEGEEPFVMKVRPASEIKEKRPRKRPATPGVPFANRCTDRRTAGPGRKSKRAKSS